MKNVFFILVCLNISAACNHPLSHTVNINGKTISVDTIQFLPAVKHRKELDERINGLLSLESMDKINDRLEIRITRTYSEREPMYMLVISEKDGVWSGFAVALQLEVDWARNVFRLAPKTIGRKPVDGWDGLGAQLVNMGILKIGDSITLEHHGVSTDADDVRVAYASKNGRREYTVYEPCSIPSPGKKEMVQILQLIDKELGFARFTGLP